MIYAYDMILRDITLFHYATLPSIIFAMLPYATMMRLLRFSFISIFAVISLRDAD